MKTSRFLQEGDEMHYAISNIQPIPDNEESTCSGNVNIYQQGEEAVMFRYSLSGLSISEP